MRPGPVRNRQEFAALRERGARSRHRPVRVTYLAGPDAVRIAFAIGRRTGTAVRRNRLRRRIRAIVAGRSLPGGSYLFVAGPAAIDLPFGSLRTVVLTALDEVRPR